MYHLPIKTNTFNQPKLWCMMCAGILSMSMMLGDVQACKPPILPLEIQTTASPAFGEPDNCLIYKGNDTENQDILLENKCDATVQITPNLCNNDPCDILKIEPNESSMLNVDTGKPNIDNVFVFTWASDDKMGQIDIRLSQEIQSGGCPPMNEALCQITPLSGSTTPHQLLLLMLFGCVALRLKKRHNH